MPILKPVATNKHTVKDSFNFATEVVDQNSSNLMSCLDTDSLFNNIPLEKPIEICTNELFKKQRHYLKKLI